MNRLFLLIATILVPTVAGIGIVVALVMGMGDARSIVIATIIGAVIGIPVSWFAARQIRENDLEIEE